MENLKCWNCMYLNHEEGTYWCGKQDNNRLISQYGENENANACKYYTPERVSVSWNNSEINYDELPF